MTSAPVPSSDALAAQRRRSARPRGPPGVTPTARAAATAASVFSRLWRAGERQLELDPLASPAPRATAPRRARPPRSERPRARRRRRPKRHDLQRRRAATAPAAARRRARPPSRRREAASSSALARATPSSEPDLLEVDGPDVGDHADVGLGDRAPARRSARTRACPSRARAPRCPAGAARIASGSPISVLKFAGLAATRAVRGDQRGDQVLRRGLADRAGDARSRARAELAPPGARQRAAARQRVVGDAAPRPLAATASAAHSGVDEHAPRARRQRRRRRTSRRPRARPASPTNRSPGPISRESIADPRRAVGRAAVGTRAQQLGAGRPGDPAVAPVPHARA